MDLLAHFGVCILGCLVADFALHLARLEVRRRDRRDALREHTLREHTLRDRGRETSPTYRGKLI